MASLQVLFGVVLRQHREAAGLSQEALAAKAGLHRNYVGQLERGRMMPSLAVVQQLAVALGLPMSELIVDVERQLLAATSPPNQTTKGASGPG